MQQLLQAKRPGTSLVRDAPLLTDRSYCIVSIIPFIISTVALTPLYGDESLIQCGIFPGFSNLILNNKVIKFLRVSVLMSPTIMKIGLGWRGGRGMEKQLGGGRIRHF